jgi:hypothetical protein
VSWDFGFHFFDVPALAGWESEEYRGAMGIAGGLWSVKPEPFCLFLGAAEVF